MLKIVLALNKNVILAINDKDEEIVVQGNGIGFKRKKDDEKVFPVQVTPDMFKSAEKNQDTFNLPFRRGNDFYNRYKEDIALMGEMVFKTFRMSIAWERLFPTGREEKPCPEGVEFYQNVFAVCHRNGIDPLVTMIQFITILQFT